MPEILKAAIRTHGFSLNLHLPDGLSGRVSRATNASVLHLQLHSGMHPKAPVRDAAGVAPPAEEEDMISAILSLEPPKVLYVSQGLSEKHVCFAAMCVEVVKIVQHLAGCCLLPRKLAALVFCAFAKGNAPFFLT